MLTVTDNTMKYEEFMDILRFLGNQYVLKKFKAYEFTDQNGIRMVRIDELLYEQKFN